MLRKCYFFPYCKVSDFWTKKSSALFHRLLKTELQLDRHSNRFLPYKASHIGYPNILLLFKVTLEVIVQPLYFTDE